MKFSIIIPSVKQTDLVKSCVEHLRVFEPDQSRYEIIVIDDGSDEHIQHWLSGYCAANNVRLILKAQNRGFSHTVNAGLEAGLGEYLILYNNDVQAIGPILDNIERAFARHPDIGIVGAKLLFPDMRIQHAGVVRFPGSCVFTHINKHVARDNPQVNTSKYCISVTGALFAIRRRAYEIIGKFNDEYFIACEDSEYCVRAWSKNQRVFYDHTVEAIHLEGHTRGNDNHTKLRKGPEWFLKEKEAVARFQHDMQKYNLDLLEQKVVQVNSGADISTPLSTEPKRLEIGCGNYPHPGYLHMDVRALPHVEYVCDFSKERLPFPDNDLDEIMSQHSIEHISWRKLPFVLGEWRRVLKPGGRVFFRTPDLEFICRTYLEGRTTPEFPPDEKFIQENLSAQVTPAWWANLKLFAGQDYDSNYHYFAFDFKMAKELLERYGFENVRRLSIHPEISPGELQVEAFKAGPKDINVKSHTVKVLVKRKGALGDVIMATPIVRRLREELGQQAVINVATDSGVVFQNNLNVNAVFPGNHSPVGYDRVIDLDFCYERSPKMHIIDAYSMLAFKDTDYDRSTSLVLLDGDYNNVTDMLRSHMVDPKKMVVVHAGVTWKNRTWPKEYWERAITKIIEGGMQVVMVGSGSDISIKMPGVLDFTRQLTLHQIAALADMAQCFVGNDSGILHIAGTTRVPIVGIYTSAKGEYRVPFRNGAYGTNCRILKPTVDCYGCLHDEPAPVVYCDCRRGDFICLGQITPEMVAQAVREVTNVI